MTFPEEIKKIRQCKFLSQESFAREIGVSFSSVNRWERGKSKPNLIAMKNIIEFCSKNSIQCEQLESLWKVLSEN